MISTRQLKVLIHCRKSTSPKIRTILKASAMATLDSLPISVFTKMTRGLEQGHLTVALVSPQLIQKLNSQYRGKSKPTDVLSFSRIEKNTFPLLQNDDLGDVLICWDIAKKQAKAYATSLEDELARLTVHGVLHLFGYDHERSPKDEKKMFSLQNKILRNLKKL